MKKRLGLLIVAGISITALGAYSLFGTKDSPANGISIEVGKINEQTNKKLYNRLVQRYNNLARLI